MKICKDKQKDRDRDKSGRQIQRKDEKKERDNRREINKGQGAVDSQKDRGKGKTENYREIRQRTDTENRDEETVG